MHYPPNKVFFASSNSSLTPEVEVKIVDLRPLLFLSSYFLSALVSTIGFGSGFGSGLGAGLGFGLDIQLHDGAFLFLRHSRFSFKDKNFIETNIKGSETTIELKINF